MEGVVLVRLMFRSTDPVRDRGIMFIVPTRGVPSCLRPVSLPDNEEDDGIIDRALGVGNCSFV